MSDNPLPKQFLVELEKLRTDPESAWEGCVKNQPNDLFPYETPDGLTAIAPLRFVAHVRDTKDRLSRRSHTGKALREITSFLSDNGYILVDPNTLDEDLFGMVYRPYFLSLQRGGSSRIIVREKQFRTGQMTWWLPSVGRTARDEKSH